MGHSGGGKWFVVGTNISYGLAGLLPIFMLGGEVGYIAGGTLFFLMVGSTLFHMSEKIGSWQNSLDVMGIYLSLWGMSLVSSVLLFDGMTRLGVNASVAALTFFAVVFVDHINSAYMVSAYVVILTVLGWMLVGPEVLAAVLLIAIAYLYRYAAGRSEHERSFSWMHGLWHVGSAMAVAFYYYMVFMW
jgi:hypothetical protein